MFELYISEMYKKTKQNQIKEIKSRDKKEQIVTQGYFFC